jgi:hypothetical protein
MFLFCHIGRNRKVVINYWLDSSIVVCGNLFDQDDMRWGSEMNQHMNSVDVVSKKPRGNSISNSFSVSLSSERSTTILVSSILRISSILEYLLMKIPILDS